VVGSMTRKQAIVRIRTNVAEDGRVLGHTLRIYVENRISYAAFDQAVQEGLAIHAADRSFLKPVPLGVPSDVPSGGLPSMQCCQPVFCWGKGRCPLDPVCGGRGFS